MPRIAALMLAAGNSQRFGSDKRLARHRQDQATLLQQSLAIPLQLKLETLLVLRQSDQKKQALLLGEHQDNLLLTCCYSLNSSQGMGFSLTDGIKQLSRYGDYDGVLIMLGDMPWIKAQTLSKIISNFDPQKIITPSYSDANGKYRQGHPVLFPSQWFKELQQLQGDQGAKRILATYRSQLKIITIDDPGIIRDVDQPEDFLN
ncbi:nucleotidyltransferase family protein [Oceanicoccus sp. KOV_DT_Chl]|uniref:nucleotidyltransferase family protein n=1 Tax=Oceanicoccus sp. KOV_DT_Chl TaxID=1904639 RepID=UPI000C7B2CFA|nr:nucleotidyltransferase family protein [Oceanicoccus sp. KOV_DT_Chl]